MKLHEFFRHVTLAACMTLWAIRCAAQAPSPMLAEDDIPTLTRASQLFEAGRIEEAAPLIVALGALPEPSMQALFLVGALNLHRGRHDLAAEAFSRMLARDPALLRPRLELARALYHTGQYDAARYHFEQALAHDLPTEVRRNVIAYVDAIRSQRASFSFSVEMVSDSNPGQATQSRTVQIGDRVYELQDSARARESRGLLWTAQGRVPLPGHETWFAQGSVEYYDYASRSMDLLYATTTLGHDIPLGSHLASVEAGWHYANYAGERLYDGAMFRITDRTRVHPSATLQVGVETRQLEYAELDFLEGRQSSLFSEGRYALSPQSHVSAGLTFTRGSSVEDAYSYDRTSLSLRYAREWRRGWITTLSGQHARSRYDGEDPFFGERRDDAENAVELGMLNRLFAYRRLAPKVTLGYAERRSNLALYSYHRAFVRVGLVTEF